MLMRGFPMQLLQHDLPEGRLAAAQGVVPLVGAGVVPLWLVWQNAH